MKKRRFYENKIFQGQYPQNLAQKLAIFSHLRTLEANFPLFSILVPRGSEIVIPENLRFLLH